MRTVGVVLGLVMAVSCARAQTVPAARDAGLAGQIAAMTREPAVAGAHWGVVVEGMEGTPVVEIHAGELFQPASNNKLMTTAAAMALLGPGDTAVTRVLGRGVLAGGTLTGYVVLEGGGDANFAVDDVPYEPPVAGRARRAAEAVEGSAEAAAKADREAHPLRGMEALADQVVRSGVRVVAGDVVGDDTRYVDEPYPEAWSTDDLLWGYGAPVSALTVHDNQIVVRVRPGLTVGSPGVVVMEAGLPAWYTVEASGLRTGAAKTGAHVAMDRAFWRAGADGATAGSGARVLRVWGTIAADAKEDVEEVAIDEPAAFAAEALKALLVARGVEVRGAARAEHREAMSARGLREQAHEAMVLPEGVAAGAVEAGRPAGEQVLGELRGPELVADETVTNKESQNLHAELLLERLGERLGGAGAADAGGTAIDRGARAQGVRVVRSFLTGRVGVAEGDVSTVDGSGLSTHDLVAPRALARLLVYAAGQPWGAAWRATLPVGGVDGSLAGRFGKGPVIGRVQAKTGTLGEARALSGYLQCASGRTVVFSILVDNHLPGGVADREVMDRMVEAVYRAE